MKIVNIVDTHGNFAPVDKIGDALSSSDLVVIAGDLTNFGGQKEAFELIESIKKYNVNVLAVTGNCDTKEVDNYLDGENINLHGRSVKVSGVLFFGAGGSLPCPSPTPNVYEEDDYANVLKLSIESSNLHCPQVMVCHQPPYLTLNDTLTNGSHVGSKSVREFIQKVQPLVCFTGHIHEAAGIDEIGKTKIVNPGPLGTGRYAYLEVSNKIDTLEIIDF